MPDLNILWGQIMPQLHMILCTVLVVTFCLSTAILPHRSVNLLKIKHLQETLG